MRLGRLTALSLSGFRGFSESRDVDLSANVVIMVGANGLGKTSLFDAVLWALSGEVPRVGGDEALISLYSDTGRARVELDAETTDARPCSIVRVWDGERSRLRVRIDGQESTGPSAQTALLKLLWPDALLTSETSAAVTSAITRSVYLQQDRVREFIEVDSDQERFNAISELVGAGRVTELQLQLEKQKKAWMQYANERARESAGVRQRLTDLEQRLSRLETIKDEERDALSIAWRQWWTAVSASPTSKLPSLSSGDAAATIDRAIKELQARRQSLLRRRTSCVDLISELNKQPPKPEIGTDSIEQAVKDAEQKLHATREQLDKALKDAAAKRQAATQTKETEEELRTLAIIALRHLGERCPVCEQKYDVDATKRRLEAATKQEGGEQPAATSIEPQVAALSQRVRECENVVATRQRELQETSARSKRYAVWKALMNQNAEEIGVDVPEGAVVAPDALDAVLKAVEEEIRVLQERIAEGEKLALEIARIGEHARKAEIQNAVLSTQRQLQELQDDAQSRLATGELAGDVLTTLREASSDVVEAELKRIGPILQRIYSAVDPHPSLRAVRFLTRVVRGRGRLATELKDVASHLKTQDPAVVLSSSQMNALAVSIFLALNLGLSRPPSATVILDDPLQSLDDVNLLGLVDLLRRIKEHRQLLISTHDPRFGQLLMRKLRPIGETQRTSVMEFQSWGRGGPVIEQYDVPVDSAQLRLVG